MKLISKLHENYRNGIRTAVFISAVFLLFGYIYDILHYMSSGNQQLLLLNAVSAVLVIISTALFALQIIKVPTSFFIIVYVVLLNSMFSNFYLLLNNDSSWYAYYLRDSLFLSVLCLFSALLIGRFHAIVYGLLFIIASVVLTLLGDNQFMRENVLMIVTIFSAISVVAFYLITLLQNSVSELVNLNETINYQNEEIHSQVEELQSQTEQLRKSNELLLQQQNEILDKNKALEKANQTKIKFFSVIGHDLRNPFNLILNYAEMLYVRFNIIDNDKKIKYIKSLKELSRNTYRLFENLLNWSRSQTNFIEPVIRQVDINELVEQSLTLLGEEIKNKSIQFSFSDNNCSSILTDKDILDTVLRNLLSNAIKYTFEGGHVYVECFKPEKEVIIKVHDDGIGIEPELAAQLFDGEYNSSMHGTKGETGTGLGLQICYEFLQRINATIELESNKDKGSTFIIRLPQHFPAHFEIIDELMHN